MALIRCAARPFFIRLKIFLYRPPSSGGPLRIHATKIRFGHSANGNHLLPRRKALRTIPPICEKALAFLYFYPRASPITRKVKF